MRKPHWSERWWVHLAFGLAMIAASVLVFWDLSDWEAHPDRSLSMHWLAAPIYSARRQMAAVGNCSRGRVYSDRQWISPPASSTPMRSHAAGRGRS